MFPINLKVVGVTYDSMSFKNIDITKEVEIPVGNHVGAFGAERRYDVHKGVDLYCPTGTSVYAIESGKIVQIRCFTGKRANCDWWEDTQTISIEGKSGDSVEECQLLGNVERVLKHDKGRPTSMLHLALHHHGVLRNGVWQKGTPQPYGLLDPTNQLIRMSL